MTQLEHTTFAELISAHLDAAYNLARWLLGDEEAAADVTHDACIRAMKGFKTYRGGGRTWLLTIVRNTAYNYLRSQKRAELIPLADGIDAIPIGDDPETLLIREADAKVIREAVESLETEYREALILREMEELSYKEIAAMQNVPVGTVMSRLSRARAQIKRKILEMEGVR